MHVARRSPFGMHAARESHLHECLAPPGGVTAP